MLPRAAVEDVLDQQGGRAATLSGRRLSSPPEACDGSISCDGKHPGIEVVDLRGNVPTRLRKLRDRVTGMASCWRELEWNGWATIWQAVPSILKGHSFTCDVLALERFLPAGGQGVIALQVRSDDDNAREIVEAINDRRNAFVFAGGAGIPASVAGRLRIARRRAGDDFGFGMKFRAQVFEPPRIEPRLARVEGESP